jgi:hypothetical protein
MQQCRDSLRNTKQRKLLCRFFVPRKQIKHHGSPEGSRSSKVTIHHAPASISSLGAAVESLLAPVFKPRTAKAVKRRQWPQQQKPSQGIVNRSKDLSHPKIGSQDTNELALLAPIFSKNIGSVSQPSLLKHNPAHNQRTSLTNHRKNGTQRRCTRPKQADGPTHTLLSYGFTSRRLTR